MHEEVAHAVKILNQGGIIIFPTDTAFGIGCRMDNEKAVERLFNLRRRPQTKATPVLVASIHMAQKYLHPIPQEVKEKLMKPYWPGALTIVLPCLTSRVPSLVRGGGKTLGVRMPDHPVPLELMKTINVPLLAPSANFAGEKTPFTIQDVDPRLIEQVDYLVPGDAGGTQASTVIDCSVNPWKIQRQGAVILQN
jgi:L-threonylcarbamoyladenylate synthase